MLFQSNEFLFFFLPIFLFIYYLVPNSSRRALLVVGSYFFYGWWNYNYVGLLLISTLINYLCGQKIHQSSNRKIRKVFLLISIFANLGLLGFFKYFMFTNQSLAGLAEIFGLGYPSYLLGIKILLPIGISFFTFQGLSYTIDIYRLNTKPAKNIIDFGSYLAMFPQLIAGPIVRFSTMAPQLRKPNISISTFNLGLQFFIIGLAKKVLIADNVSCIADNFFNAGSLSSFSSLDAVLGTLAYSVQIYFDFSGYSDMAVGLGYFLGYQFPQNFDSPYKSGSFSEFWRKWHMTLSFWLRDYLYIPLGGSRKTKNSTYINLTITFLLCGLWHGAQWTFVVWGIWHGLFVMFERMLGEQNPFSRLPNPLKVTGCFSLVTLGWIFFRAYDLGHAVDIFRLIFSFKFSGNALISAGDALSNGFLLIGLVIAFAFPNTWQFKTETSPVKTALLALLLLLSIMFIFGSTTHPFLYFQF